MSRKDKSKNNKKRSVEEEDVDIDNEEQIGQQGDDHDNDKDGEDGDVEGDREKKKKKEKKSKKSKKEKKKSSSDDVDVDAEVDTQKIDKDSAKEGNGQPVVKPGFFATETFESLPLSESTQSSLKLMGYKHMTKIQAKSIPSLLSGKDLIGAAKTGSGTSRA